MLWTGINMLLDSGIWIFYKIYEKYILRPVVDKIVLMCHLEGICVYDVYFSHSIPFMNAYSTNSTEIISNFNDYSRVFLVKWSANNSRKIYTYLDQNFHNVFLFLLREISFPWEWYVCSPVVYSFLVLVRNFREYRIRVWIFWWWTVKLHLFLNYLLLKSNL
jgi:hypothetical protein